LPHQIAPSNLDSSKGSLLVLGEEQNCCMGDSLVKFDMGNVLLGLVNQEKDCCMGVSLDQSDTGDTGVVK